MKMNIIGMATRNSGRSEVERLSRLIGRIYDAALTPELWPAVVEEIVCAVSANSGQLFTPFDTADRGGFHISNGICESFVRQYAAKYHAYDVWTQALVAKGLCTSGSVFTDSDLLPHRELTKTLYYREFLKPANASRACGSVIFGPEAPDLRVTFLCLYRGVGVRSFTPRSKHWIQLLSPHLSRALGIAYRLQDASFQIATTRAALDRIQSGILLLDSTGAVSFGNKAALMLLKRTTKLSLRLRADGREVLLCSHPGFNAELQRAIATALERSWISAEHFSKALHIPREKEESPLLLNFSALPSENDFGTGRTRPGAIIFARDSAQSPPIEVSLLKDLYQLTPTEIEVVRLACAGHATHEIARRRRVSIETVRSQLKRVYSKTEAIGHADLVRLIYSLAREQ